MEGVPGRPVSAMLLNPTAKDVEAFPDLTCRGTYSKDGKLELRLMNPNSKVTARDMAPVVRVRREGQRNVRKSGPLHQEQLVAPSNRHGGHSFSVVGRLQARTDPRSCVEGKGRIVRRPRRPLQRSEKTRPLAKKLRDAADVLIGSAPGRTAETTNTFYNDIPGFRDTLLLEHRSNEEALNGYGFEVVVGTAAGPKRKTPAK